MCSVSLINSKISSWVLHAVHYSSVTCGVSLNIMPTLLPATGCGQSAVCTIFVRIAPKSSTGYTFLLWGLCRKTRWNSHRYLNVTCMYMHAGYRVHKELAFDHEGLNWICKMYVIDSIRSFYLILRDHTKGSNLVANISAVLNDIIIRKFGTYWVPFHENGDISPYLSMLLGFGVNLDVEVTNGDELFLRYRRRKHL